MHGDDLLAEIVAAGDITRVLLLTASAGVDDRVDGLSLGADDYLSKPFAFPELVARVRALGRRATPAAPPVLRAGDLELDPARRTVTRAGQPIELTRKEFGVLEVLLAARGSVVSSEDLLERVWDENADPFTTTVRVTMMTLRRKLGEPGLIDTVVGAGYRVADCMTPVESATRPLKAPETGVAAERIPAARRPPVRQGLRMRLTLLSTALLALIGALLLALSYLVVGRVVAALPQFPAGTQVQIGDQVMDASQAAAEIAAQGRETVLVVGLIAFPLQVLAGALLSWVLIGRTLRPLSTLTRTARALSESSLDQRIRLTGPRDEVADLADTFDDMLGRLQAAFDAERRFVANASHELRTPLAVIRTEVEVTMADPAADVGGPAPDGRGGAGGHRPGEPPADLAAAAGPHPGPRGVGAPARSIWPDLIDPALDAVDAERVIAS